MKKINLTLLLVALLTVGSQLAYAQRITVTIAGSGTAGYSGDGGWGKYAMINSPYDVCADAAQNVYFTDTANGRIRMVSAKNGLISTIAGGGVSSAEGILATYAALSPTNMCIDAAGNLYVVASSNKVRRIDAVTHIITTVAGTGVAGFSGDGGPAISATFNGICGICIDASGNLYLVDQGNYCIRKVAAGTGLVTTIAGTPGVGGFTGDGGPAIAATLSTPTAITVNPAGDVFVADQSGYLGFNAQLRKIDAGTGIITTIAGGTTGGAIFGVPLMSTWLADVTGLCIDRHGNFFCNEVSCSCRRLDMSTDSSYAVGGDFYTESYSDNLNSTLSYMDNPYGICVDAMENLYVADNFNNRIRKLIQVTSTPTFAYGQGAYLATCPGATVVFDSMLTITDLEAGQTETFTVISAPTHGTLSGFPATAVSNGTVSITRPSGLSYTASTYVGSDSFQVQVSDGGLADTFTIYVVSGTSSITGVSTMCTGTTVALSNDDATGAWTTSNSNATISADGVITATTAGTDTALYTVTNTCGTVAAELSLTINTVPDAGAITSTTANICKGSSLVLADVVAGGTWHASNANVSISGTGALSALSVGADTVFYTVTNSCGNNSASEVITVTPCDATGVALVSYAVPNLFPNPASSSINVQWDALLTGSVNISIADLAGRVVSSSQLSATGTNAAVVDVSALQNGIYLLTMSSADMQHFTYKVAVNK